MEGGVVRIYDFYTMNSRSVEPVEPVLHVYEFVLGVECNIQDVCHLNLIQRP